MEPVIHLLRWNHYQMVYGPVPVHGLGVGDHWDIYISLQKMYLVGHETTVGLSSNNILTRKNWFILKLKRKCFLCILHYRTSDFVVLYSVYTRCMKHCKNIVGIGVNILNTWKKFTQLALFFTTFLCFQYCLYLIFFFYPAPLLSPVPQDCSKNSTQRVRHTNSPL